MEPAHQLDLLAVFRQMGLHGQIALAREAAEEREQRLRTGGHKARREHGPHAREAAARVEPAQRLAHGFLRRLLQTVDAVLVHVHLAGIAGDARALERVHQQERRLRVQRGEDAHARGAVFDERLRKVCKDLARKTGVGKARLGGEGVALEPGQQRRVHAKPQHGVLRRMQVHVRKRLEDQPVAEMLHRRVRKPGRARGGYARDHAVAQGDVAVFHDVQRAGRRRGDDVPFDELQQAAAPLSVDLAKKKRPGGSRAAASPERS